jgi:hypothetical protein
MKKIVFFTEMGFNGKTSRTHNNMRTEFAWFTALNADHIPIDTLMSGGMVNNQYDLGIVILPKNIRWDASIVTKMKQICDKTAFMQEGPSWYYQSLPLKQSMWFLNEMLSVDVVFAHNDIDKLYYEGLLEKPTYINPTLMITDSLKDLPKVERSGIIMGGNLGRWYGGIDSYMVSCVFDEPIYAPQMGRMQKEELDIDEITHLPYLNWYDWMVRLNEFKYAVHLNPNTIGGTFSLNCAYLGIPCIGNIDSNTQRLCFPETSVDPRDIKSAIGVAKRLSTDVDFYNEVSETAISEYAINFSEKSYINQWNFIKSELFK